MALQAVNSRAAGCTHHTAFKAAAQPAVSRSCSVRARAQQQKTEQAVAATEYVESTSALGKRALLAAAAATVTATTAGYVRGGLCGDVLWASCRSLAMLLLLLLCCLCCHSYSVACILSSRNTCGVVFLASVQEGSLAPATQQFRK